MTPLGPISAERMRAKPGSVPDTWDIEELESDQRLALNNLRLFLNSVRRGKRERRVNYDRHTFSTVALGAPEPKSIP